MTALEARTHLALLEAERAAAGDGPMEGQQAYMAELEDEITTWRQVYTAAAVTEIASLRAELFGPQEG